MSGFRQYDRALRASVARLSGGVSTYAFAEAWRNWAYHLASAPGRQQELAFHAWRSACLFGAHAAAGESDTPPFTPRQSDHRFDDDGWRTNPYRMWQQGFLAVQDWWEAACADLPGLDPQDAERTAFMARQSLDILSPSNFPALNPEIMRTAIASAGQSLVEGTANLARDMAKLASQRPDPAPEGFRVGRDLACTPGTVIFRNALFELIQYHPTTPQVRPEPVLIVPAWIMKYYILDLSPRNSMIRHLVGRGFTVFVISWCNPTAEQAGLSLENYRMDGIMAALEVIRTVVPRRKVHAVGYCLGGTMLAITAATMARDGDDRLASITLMAAQVDFAEAGELLLFVDESQVAFLEDMMWQQGYLDRPQMARTFSTIRAEDLIWSRAVRRYWLGRQDLPTDMEVWLSDTTRMPARMHSQYLRALFLENRLTAGRFAVEGRVIALRDISAPAFVVATRSDHIAPWRSVYKTQLFTSCALDFVLTQGGHNSGIVNPPKMARTGYQWTHRPAGGHYRGPDDWETSAERQDGSWWPRWFDWLAARSGDVTSPPPMGASEAGLPALMAAPGSYIYQT